MQTVALLVRFSISFAVIADPPALPPAPTSAQVDRYHGREVADPFRPLEELDAPETVAWAAAQDARTRRVLSRVPGRAALERRLLARWNFERASIPARAGGRLFYSYNAGLSEQDSIRAVDDASGAASTILDASDWSADGSISLASWSLSPSGRYIAYARSVAGSDWWEWRVHDVRDGRDLDERITRGCYVPSTWRKDEAGFFYTRVPEGVADATVFSLLHYHALGTDPEEDVLVLDTGDRPWLFVRAAVDDTGRFVVIDAFDSRSSENEILLVPVDRLDAPPQPLVTGDRSQFRYVGNDGDRFWFWTNERGAERWKVVGVDRGDEPGRGASSRFEVVVPEGELPLESVRRVGGRFVCRYLDDAKSVLRIVDDHGAVEREVGLPGVVTVTSVGGRDDASEAFFDVEGFTHPPSVLRLDVATGEIRPFHTPNVPFDADDFVTEQVFFESRDGTRVPMFVTRRADVAPDGERPVYLYGYGGFYASQTPGFSPVMLEWMERGGVYALANLRGGGEYGLRWHEGGMRGNKQNVFDDFIAAAECLIDAGWTNPSKLAIGGRSNGGLLVGACLTQRPDLFGACVAQVGLFDMLRYDRFPLGKTWRNEYGSSDDRRMFEVLRGYSPLHCVRDGERYPPTLLTTADHDDRVPPSHSYKFAAALQRAQGGEAPILLRVASRAGHGAGTSTSRAIAEWVDVQAFLADALDFPLDAP